jgi:hypothetical protein
MEVPIHLDFYKYKHFCNCRNIEQLYKYKNYGLWKFKKE